MRRGPSSLALAAGLATCVAIGGCGLGASSVAGRVVDADGPVPGATVRVQATETSTTTGDDGRFELDVKGEGPARLAAWAPGYFIAGGDEHEPGTRDVEIELVELPEDDNPSYEWLPAGGAAGEGEDQACDACHSYGEEGKDLTLPVEQWLRDAHSGSATNPRFLTMYVGTDVAGNASPPTRFAETRDYGRVPLRPDLSKAYFGPGYKLDFPDTAGNCAACHVPAAATDDAYGVDPRDATGVSAEGVTCDFCHKVWDVLLDADTGLPDPSMPGVLSFEFRRPEEGHQFFAGPFDDVAPGEDTYSPLQRESAYCAPCHHGVFWGVVVYDSFGEWLRSPYSDADGGQTCQDCHMPATGATRFATPDAGGLVRDPDTIPGHLMPGAADEELLENAVTMEVDAEREGDRVTVAVEITNDQTGHHVPTDSPLRHLILVVEAIGPDGKALAQLTGPTIPEWCGVGDPAEGRYAGLAGTVYAKVLEELWTEVSPTGAYWMQTRVLSDNRIAAFETDRTEYAFEAREAGTVDVEVRLLFRRAFIELAEQKGWDVDDIRMEHFATRIDPAR